MTWSHVRTKYGPRYLTDPINLTKKKMGFKKDYNWFSLPRIYIKSWKNVTSFIDRQISTLTRNSLKKISLMRKLRNFLNKSNIWRFNKRHAKIVALFLHSGQGKPSSQHYYSA